MNHINSLSQPKLFTSLIKNPLTLKTAMSNLLIDSGGRSPLLEFKRVFENDYEYGIIIKYLYLFIEIKILSEAINALGGFWLKIYLTKPIGNVLDSERSEECIDFTMMCVFFFVSVYSITSRNNAPISNYGGGFRCKSEYPWCIIE
ncbi:Uncharacterized protein FWK35_00009198, partial [Aphis craccivora]